MIHDPYFGPFTNVPYQNILQNAQLGVWSDTLFEIGASERCGD